MRQAGWSNPAANMLIVFDGYRLAVEYREGTKGERMEPSQSLAGYYSTREIMALFGWRTRAQVSATAKSQGWAALRVGNVALYRGEDVVAYAQKRRRTRLAEELGWSWSGHPRTTRLIEDDGFDIACPVCGAQALLKIPQTAELIAAYIDSVNQETPWPWRCANGHGGGQDGVV